MRPIRVLMLSPTPEEAASARFRVYQYVPALEQEGFEVTVSSFHTPGSFQILYEPGRYPEKVARFVWQALRRVRLLSRADRYDVFFVHREVLALGPPLAERFLARPGRALVYDFDDAIYLRNVSDANRLVALLKWPRKVPEIVARSRYVLAGNRHLAEYARRYNPAVSVLPTSVDTHVFVPRASDERANDPPVLGWIGSPTTVRYLLDLEEPIRRLARRQRFRLRVAGAGHPVAFDGALVDNVRWSLQGEVALFNQCDIGLYPLPDDEWTRGKCGFKAIQFMACGVPVVAAPVGVNRDLIQDGVNGFLAATPEEWVEKLSWLLEDADLRVRLGRAGRATVMERFALHIHAPVLAKLFRELVQG